MRLRRRPEVRLLALAAIAAAAVLTIRSSHAPDDGAAPAPPATWRGLVGDAHHAVSLGDRMIVVLRTPSVAQRLGRGKLATEQDERRWTAEAYASQQQVLTQLARHGLVVRPDYSFARVLDGFSAALDPRAVGLLDRNPEVAGVYPVRAAFPAAISAASAASGTAPVGTGAGVPGLDGSGVTVALLDTGVDSAQPYLGGRIEPGIDIVGGSSVGAVQRDSHHHRRVERHGTELAGLLVGAGGPAGSHGVAPGASVLPLRVAGWQDAGNGADALYARSDQVIAGLDRAVDPNMDGDTHDAVRVALIGVAEPFAGFADSPEAQAVAGALALDVLVVAPAGNSGAAGPLFGSIAGPAGAPAALSVGALDTRPSTSTVRVVLRQGLVALFAGTLPLLDAIAAARPVEAPIALPRLETSLAGKAALVAGGKSPVATVASAVKAGASAVLVYGAQPPPGSLADLGVPVVGIGSDHARAVLKAIGAGATIYAALGRPTAGPNADLGLVTSFSSRGLTFDGQPAPQLAAPGVGVLTSDPGSTGDGGPAFAAVTGTSVSAASAAGSAALLFGERPGLSAQDVASLLAGEARRVGGTGVVDAGASAVGEVAASLTSLGFGIWPGPGRHVTRTLELHNVSIRSLEIKLSSSSTLVAVRPARLKIPAGGIAKVVVKAGSSVQPSGPVVEGVVTVAPLGAERLRIPWAIAVSPPADTLVGAVTLAPRAFTPSDTSPAVLRLAVGSLAGGATVEIEPVARLDVLLYSSRGAFLGVLSRSRDLLPGTYSFGITGRGPGGAPLAPGSYELRLVAWPVYPGGPSRARIGFRIQ